MKTIFWVLGLAIFLSSCASEKAYQSYLDAQNSNSTGYYAAAAKPLVDITLPAPAGQEYKIVVNRDIKPITVSQIKDSEWTGLGTATVVGASLVASKGFDWKIKQSDNAAAVQMRQADDQAVTSQVQSYTNNFSKEKITETLIDGSTATTPQ